VTIALKAGAFFGQTVSARLAGAVLSEVRHDLGRTVPQHSHEHAYFSLLVEGSYHETSGNATIMYDSFTVVFHAPLMEHTDTIGPAGGRFFMVELLPHWTEMIAGEGSLPEHFVDLSGGDSAWLMSRLYRCSTNCAPLPSIYRKSHAKSRHGWPISTGTYSGISQRPSRLRCWRGMLEFIPHTYVAPFIVSGAVRSATTSSGFVCSWRAGA